MRSKNRGRQARQVRARNARAPSGSNPFAEIVKNADPKSRPLLAIFAALPSGVIAAAISFVASATASGITGSALRVDGVVVRSIACVATSLRGECFTCLFLPYVADFFSGSLA
jgi:hypothetical protein